jgi:chromosome segregation ATPase
VSEGETSRVLDYTGLLNEKENQVVELEKKIQNLEERLQRFTKRENDLENEIIRLKQAIKTLNTPNCSKIDLDKLLNGSLEYQTLNEKYGKLRNQFGAVGGLIRTQFDLLRSAGARL